MTKATVSTVIIQSDKCYNFVCIICHCKWFSFCKILHFSSHMGKTGWCKLCTTCQGISGNYRDFIYFVWQYQVIYRTVLLRISGPTHGMYCRPSYEWTCLYGGSKILVYNGNMWNMYEYLCRLLSSIVIYLHSLQGELYLYTMCNSISIIKPLSP